MIVRHRSGPSDASRAAVAADFAEAVLGCARSLRQMILAGHAYAMVPAALASPQVLGYAIADLDARYGDVDLRFGNLCAATADARAVDGVAWICLRSRCPARLAELGEIVDLGAAHGWPDHRVRLDAVAALAEQTDPIARIERRVLYALEGPSAHPLLAAGMPTA